MIYAPLGKTGLKVSRIGIGCQDLAGTFYKKRSDGALRMLDAALDRGVNFFDTADMYAFGESERLLGRAFKGKRAQAVIATKGGYRYTRLGRLFGKVSPLAAPFYPLYRRFGPAINHKKRALRFRDHSPAYLIKAVHASLKRLQTDYIDLYQLHDPPASVIAKDDWCAVLEKLKSQGKIRHYGVSCLNHEDAASSLNRPGVEALQITYNLLDRHAEERLFAAAAGKGAGLISRLPFAQGLLTGSKETKAGHTAEKPESLLKLKARANALTFLAAGDRTLAQSALLFVLARPEIASVIPGLSSEKHLVEALGALDAAPLTGEEKNLISAV